MNITNLILSCLFASIHTIFAQNYLSLTFTATMQDDSWNALDSVNITNESRSWMETLYYPDTTLQMINSVGIEEAKANSLQLFQNSLNPFSGTTEVPLHIPYKDNITMVLYDISGKQCAVYDATVEGGLHAFTINVVAAQMYLLKVHTSRGSRSIKMLSTGTGGSYGIKPRAMHPQIIQKSFTDHEFQSNDSMVYTGYATYKGEPRTQTLSFLQTGNDTTLCFEFPLPDYKTLRFKAQMDSSYYPLDSIKIINRLYIWNVKWKEMLYYPDTTLQFILTQQKGISTNRMNINDNLFLQGYFTCNGVAKNKNIYSRYMGTEDSLYTFSLDTMLMKTEHLFFMYLPLNDCNYDSSVIIINTEEEYEYFKTCTGVASVLPEIDFTNQTLVIANGGSSSGIAWLRSDFIKTIENEYIFSVFIQCDATAVGIGWTEPILVSPKLSPTEAIILNVQIYQ